MTKQIKLFNLDLHVGVISDFVNICNRIYPNEIMIDNNSMAFQSVLFNKKPNNTFIINQKTWKNINEKMIEDFYNKHKDLLETYDGFVVTHSPIFCLLYEKFNKPIILINSCRYEQPASHTGNLELWEFINTGLQRLYSKKLLIPISNNLFDREYLSVGSGIESIRIPSLCLYTNVNYNLTGYKLKNKFLLYSSLKETEKYINNPNIINVKNIKPYKFADLINFKAIIHIPYEISTMSLFEHYSMNIPLLMPSKKFLIELYNNNNINFYGSYPVLFNTHKYPEKLNGLLNSKWFVNIVEYADYYNSNTFKFITYFDSFKDLESLLLKTDFEDISKNMAIFNKKRRHKIYTQWIEILNNTFKINNQKINDVNLYNNLYNNIDNIITCDNYMKHINNLNSNLIQYHKFEFIFNSAMWRNKLINKYNGDSKVLVLGHSDYTFENKIYYYLKSQPNKLEYIFAVNCDSIINKCYSIPLGLTNDCNDSSIHKIYGNTDILVKVSNEDISKNKLVYLNVNPNTHKERLEVVSKFKDKSYVTYEEPLNIPINNKDDFNKMFNSRINFLRKIREHYFVLCPRGNGIDTHRLWESLYMGSIPVVIYSDIYASMLDLPILFINDWNEINEELLLKKLKYMSTCKYNMNKLYLNYWFELMNKKI